MSSNTGHEVRSDSRTILRGTGIVSTLTLISRILGFLRDLVMARAFGAGQFSDAFFAASKIPNLLRSIVGEGALTAAFVPVFSSELAKGKEDAQKALASVAALLFLTTIVLTLLGIVFAPQIVDFFGFDHSSGQFSLCVLLTRVMMPYIIFISFVAMMNGALGALHIFGASALAQVIMNIVLIAGALVAALYEPRSGVILLALSVVLGGVVQVLAQLPFLNRAGLKLPARTAIVTPVTRQVLRLITPAIAGAAVYQISVFIGTMFASYLPPGSVSWLYFADRLAQLPIGVFTIALASVLLPTLSRAKADGNIESFSRQLSDALRYTSFAMIPCSCLLFYFAGPSIELLFEGGQFSGESTHNTALALRGYALGLWALSCHTMVMRAFIAHKDTVTPTFVGVITLACNIFLSLLLMGPFEGSGPGLVQQFIVGASHLINELPFAFDLRHTGLALASSLSAFVTFGLGALILSKRQPVLDWTPFIRTSIKTGLASALMVAAAYYIDPWLSGPIMRLGIGGVISLTTFLLSAWILKIDELRETAAFAKNLLQR